jgi:hypothetical protein
VSRTEMGAPSTSALSNALSQHVAAQDAGAHFGRQGLIELQRRWLAVGEMALGPGTGMQCPTPSPSRKCTLTAAAQHTTQVA